MHACFLSFCLYLVSHCIHCSSFFVSPFSFTLILSTSFHTSRKKQKKRIQRRKRKRLRKRKQIKKRKRPSKRKQRRKRKKLSRRKRRRKRKKLSRRKHRSFFERSFPPFSLRFSFLYPLLSFSLSLPYALSSLSLSLILSIFWYSTGN